MCLRLRFSAIILSFLQRSALQLPLSYLLLQKGSSIQQRNECMYAFFQFAACVSQHLQVRQHPQEAGLDNRQKCITSTLRTQIILVMCSSSSALIVFGPQI